MRAILSLKKLLFPVVCLLILSAFGQKSRLPYNVSKNAYDSTLKKTEAVFEFRFSDGIKRIQTEIKMAYNGKNIKTTYDAQGRFSLKVTPGKYKFQFFYNERYFEITTDSILIKPAHRAVVEVFFQSADMLIECDKPVIYVYSPEATAVSIQLQPKGKFGFTYPEYKNGWSFIADSSGTLRMEKKKYNYLFWDGQVEISGNNFNWEEGAVVAKDSLVNFFETSLSKMGLSEKEQEDFITYWCPLMMKNSRNYIHFIFNEAYNEYASIEITPKPETLFRVFMLWENAEGKEIQNLKPQSFPAFCRKGLTVVEWGGAHLPEGSIPFE
jgi:hypothetical protein